MGSFSFYRADRTTKQANFVSNADKMRVMIPAEYIGHYGAPSLCGPYEDYGNVRVHRPDGTEVVLDVYGFLAYVNRDMPYKDGKVKDYYIDKDGGWDDTNVQDNRIIGIELGCYACTMRNCKYPLKLCSASYKGTYESLSAFSAGDANQGFIAEYWDSLLHNDISVDEFCDKECKIL